MTHIKANNPIVIDGIAFNWNIKRILLFLRILPLLCVSYRLNMSVEISLTRIIIKDSNIAAIYYYDNIILIIISILSGMTRNETSYRGLQLFPENFTRNRRGRGGM